MRGKAIKKILIKHEIFSQKAQLHPFWGIFSHFLTFSIIMFAFSTFLSVSSTSANRLKVLCLDYGVNVEQTKLMRVKISACFGLPFGIFDCSLAHLTGSLGLFGIYVRKFLYFLFLLMCSKKIVSN